MKNVKDVRLDLEGDHEWRLEIYLGKFFENTIWTWNNFLNKIVKNDAPYMILGTNFQCLLNVVDCTLFVKIDSLKMLKTETS